MLGLKLREEFTGRRLKGTMIELHNRKGTGALDKSASDFLKITYPSIDIKKWRIIQNGIAIVQNIWFIQLMRT